MKNDLTYITSMRLREALAENNMTAQELSNKSGVGKSSISQYVNGSHSPNNISAYKMSIVLKVRPEWLMGFEVDKEYDKDLMEMAITTARIKMIEKLPEEGKKELDSFIDYLLAKYSK